MTRANPRVQQPLLEVKNLKTHFFTDEGTVKAVDGVGFEVYKGEVFGLVGESGCGKSVTALSILRLVRSPGRIVNGEVIFDGVNMLDSPERVMRRIRGSRISMIFQQPLMSLNPVFSIGDQVSEVLRVHLPIDKEEARRKAVDLLRQVDIPDPEERMRIYPHEISGGQAQRVMIASAIALDPELLIADEPTTALDVTIQAQILDLLQGLQKRSNTSIILITHNLGVIAEMADRVAVMYAGHIVEQATTRNLLDEPCHPYTQGLIASIPQLGRVKERLDVIPGTVPRLIDMEPGCRFASRCRARQQYGLEICTEKEPDLISIKDDRIVRCWLYQRAEGHQAPLI